MYCMKRRVNHF